MRIITFLLLISLLNCWKVYTRNETVLEKQTLETKEVKEQKDVFILTHSLTPKGLFLFLDAYKVEEQSQIDFIREKYRENKDFTFNDKYNFQEKCKGCGTGGLFILPIVVSVILIELTTIPFRLMSLQQERIREEMRKRNANKIKSLSTNNVHFALLDKNSNRKYNFQTDRIFIPIAELKLDSINSKKFPYQLIDSKTQNILLTGEFDFSESISKYKEFEPILEENNLNNKISECKLIYPSFINSRITYDKAKMELDTICSNYADREVNDFTESQRRHTYCFDNFEGCYYLLKSEKKSKNH